MAELARLDAQLSQIAARREGLRRMLGATTPTPAHRLFRVK